MLRRRQLSMVLGVPRPDRDRPLTATSPDVSDPFNSTTTLRRKNYERVVSKQRLLVPLEPVRIESHGSTGFLPRTVGKQGEVQTGVDQLRAARVRHGCGAR